MSIFDEQFEHLRSKYPDAKSRPRPDGSYFVELTSALPPGWNKQQARLYFIVPVGFPAARPDCFWSDKDLRLQSGGMPANASENNSHGETDSLLWFSYHPSTWSPNNDSLMTYVRLILQRLREAR